MSGPVETHRSFVNTWECDENAHLNVQFYVKRFEEAARFFAAACGKSQAAVVRSRHIRYHAELHGGAITRIRSATIADGRFAGHVVHLMESVTSGKLAASALDGPFDGVSAFRIHEHEVAAALPRGITEPPPAPLAGRDVLAAGGLVSSRSVVLPAECGADGAFLQYCHVGRLSDGAAQTWEHAGIGIAWLRRHNYGRVALEMRITRHAEARAGDLLAVYSNHAPLEGRTIRLRHEIIRVGDERAIATGEVVAVILDLTTRKTVALSLDDLKRAASER